MTHHPYRVAMAKGRLDAAREDAERLMAAWLAAQERAHDLRSQYVEARIAESRAETALGHAQRGIACGPDCYACAQHEAEEAQP